MKFSYVDKKLAMEPMKWNINSPKEVLQYAVGGLLYTPGTSTKIAGDIISKKLHNVSSICLCLEDAIGDDTVKKAELCVKETLTTIYNAVHSGEMSIDDVPLIFIRVREPKQITRLARLCGTRAFSMLCGFNLPKFDKSNCDAYIEEFKVVLEKNLTSNKRPLYIMPIIESKDVMYRQRRMDQLIYINDRLVLISDYVLNIRVGATDFSGIFGIRRPIDAKIYDMSVINDCLSDIINVFARNYVCSGPVWEYFNSQGVEGAYAQIACEKIFKAPFIMYFKNFEGVFSAIEKGLSVIAITDHFDVDFFERHNLDTRQRTSYEGIISAREAFKDKITLLRGIEMGQPTYAIPLTEKSLARYDYDFVIGSIHNPREMPDYGDFDYKNMTENEIYSALDNYFEEELTLAKWNGFDTFAHSLEDVGLLFAVICVLFVSLFSRCCVFRSIN